MARSVHNDVLDAALQYLEDNADQVSVCETEPTSYAEANSLKGAGGNALARHAITSADFTIADGDTSGRKTTFAQQASITVEAAGDADHIAFVDTGNSKLLYVTTATQQALALAGTVTIEAFDIEIEDPAAPA